MKKITFLMILSLSFFSHSFSQDTTINKIGVFKLYSSVKLLDSLNFKNKLVIDNIKEGNKYQFMIPKKYDILELVTDKVSGKEIEIGGFHSFYDTNIRVFVIPKYEISKNIFLYNVGLIYNNDSLISFRSSDSYELRVMKEKKIDVNIGIDEINNIFKTKYKIIAINDTTTNDERTFTYSYKTNNNEACEIVISLRKNYYGKTTDTVYTLRLYTLKIYDLELRDYDDKVKDKNKKYNMSDF